MRPQSEVSDHTGLVGVCALGILLASAKAAELSPLLAMLLFIAGPAAAMSAWTLLREKAHLRESTGLDFSIQRPWAEVIDITRTKMLGLAATFGLFALAYFMFRTYSTPAYAFYLNAAAIAASFAWIIAPFYIIPTTRHMREPRDGLWHFGKLACLNWRVIDRELIREHLLCWTIKAFFLAVMVSILPVHVAAFLRHDLSVTFNDPLAGIQFMVQLALLFDICFGTIGYLMTFRVLDSQIGRAHV